MGVVYRGVWTVELRQCAIVLQRLCVLVFRQITQDVTITGIRQQFFLEWFLMPNRNLAAEIAKK